MNSRRAAFAGVAARRSRSAISSSGFCASLTTPKQLVADIKQIEAGWPEKVLKRQRDWVGRSEGAYIDFAVKDSDRKDSCVHHAHRHHLRRHGDRACPPSIRCSTKLLEGSALKADVDGVCREGESRTGDAGRDADEEEEKEGINTGVLAINPFSGETHSGLGGELRVDGIRHWRSDERAGA